MKSKFLALLLLIVPLLVFAGSDQKQQSQTNPKDEKEKVASPALSASKYAKDDDGAIRPTTEKEERELSQQLHQTLKKYKHYEMVTDKKGNSLVIAPFNFRWSVATVGPDGKLQYNCASNLKGIDATAKAKPKTSDSQTFEKE